MKVERIFDLLQGYRTRFRMNDALASKQNGEWVKISSREYVDRAEEVACGLLALGYQKGDRIALITNNRPEWNILDMAMAQIGVVSVPIHSSFGCAQHVTVLKHCEPRSLFVSDKILLQVLKPRLSAVPSIEHVYTFGDNDPDSWAEILRLGREQKSQLMPRLEAIRDSILPDDLLTLVYTLGTTGIPKGVMLSHKNLVSNFLGTAARNPLGFGKRALSFLPLSHVYERMMNYHYQYLGIGIYYAENVGSILKNMKEVKPHIFNTVPRFIERFFDELLGRGKDLRLRNKLIFFWAVNRVGMQYDPGNKRLWNLPFRFSLWMARKFVFSKWREAFGGKLRYIVSGGSPLQERLTRVYGAAGIMVCEGYGLTETSPVISVSNPVRHEIRPGTVGVPLDNVEIRFLDDGELLCRGPNVMLGYYRDPVRSSKVIDKEGWFHTGDVGKLVDGKYLVILDRKRDIFLLGNGARVMPQLIERKLRESLFIDQVMVVGRDKPFVSAVISPNLTFLQKWALHHKMEFSGNADLLRNPLVNERYASELDSYNELFEPAWQIKRFYLIDDEWTPQTGELSPAFKLRRRFIANKYREEISEFYKEDKEVLTDH